MLVTCEKFIKFGFHKINNICIVMFVRCWVHFVFVFFFFSFIHLLFVLKVNKKMGRKRFCNGQESNGEKKHPQKKYFQQQLFEHFEQSKQRKKKQTQCKGSTKKTVQKHVNLGCLCEILVCG